MEASSPTRAGCHAQRKRPRQRPAGHAPCALMMQPGQNNFPLRRPRPHNPLPRREPLPARPSTFANRCPRPSPCYTALHHAQRRPRTSGQSRTRHPIGNWRWQSEIPSPHTHPPPSPQTPPSANQITYHCRTNLKMATLDPARLWRALTRISHLSNHGPSSDQKWIKLLGRSWLWRCKICSNAKATRKEEMNMKWLIDGADRNAGEEIALVLDAARQIPGSGRREQPRHLGHPSSCHRRRFPGAPPAAVSQADTDRRRRGSRAMPRW